MQYGYSLMSYMNQYVMYQLIRPNEYHNAPNTIRYRIKERAPYWRKEKNCSFERSGTDEYEKMVNVFHCVFVSKKAIHTTDEDNEQTSTKIQSCSIFYRLFIDSRDRNWQKDVRGSGAKLLANGVVLFTRSEYAYISRSSPLAPLQWRIVRYQLLVLSRRRKQYARCAG